MDTRTLPRRSLRHELLQALGAIYDDAAEGTFPAVPPRDVVAVLNQIGPRLHERALPVVEMLLEDMFRLGQVARMPAVSPRHTPLYMCREAAEVAIDWGAPVILMPLATDEPDSLAP